MPYVEVLQKYAVFDGRAKRTEYWMFTLIQVVIAVVLVCAVFCSRRVVPCRVLAVRSRDIVAFAGCDGTATA